MNSEAKLQQVRMQMLLALDFDQDDSALVARVKQAVRDASDADLDAAFEASKEHRDFVGAIRDTARAGDASDADVTAIVGVLAAQGM